MSTPRILWALPRRGAIAARPRIFSPATQRRGLSASPVCRLADDDKPPPPPPERSPAASPSPAPQEPPQPSAPQAASPPTPPRRTLDGLGAVGALFSDASLLSRPAAAPSSKSFSPPVASAFDPQTYQISTGAPVEDGEYHLHIYATKHNTHITFTRPDKGAIISMSAGQIGFRKANRGTYDAAYQLAAHVFQKLEELRISPRNLEVVLRGFGQGREAVMKALLGSEGRMLRPSIKRVTDSTRLKFGGTRSEKPRRLG